MALAFGTASCNRAPDQAPDPASANMAPADQGGQLPPDQVAQNQAAPPAQEAQYQPPPESQPGGGEEEQISVAPQPPPPLPDYSQPPCPGDNYLWTPGYWAYSPAGYYWVPGTWVMAPWAGALWTPPWWGFAGGHYLWHAGYWGPYVGFYGGIDYGFGYTGVGFSGGYWRGDQFNYNRAALNVRAGVVHNIYDHRVENYTPANHVSFNGAGGVRVQPNASQQAAFRDRRMGALPGQVQLRRDAAGNRAQFHSVNRGRPAMVAESHPIAGRNQSPAAEPRTFGRSAAPGNARPETRTQMAPTSNARPEGRQPNLRNMPEQRSAVRQGMPAAGSARQAPQQRPEMARPAPQQRPAMARPAPQQRPEMARPAPQQRPAMARPAPQQRPEMARPAPQQRPAMARPAPQQRPEMARPQQQAKPSPVGRPAPEARPAPGKEHEKRSP